MLKIDFFPSEIIKEYEDKISAIIKARNNGKDEIEFIPNTQYKISIHDLITSERSKILSISGINLYMYICSSQKYKSMSNVELLHTLSIEYPDKVTRIEHRNSFYKYEINGVTYHTTSKTDKNNHPIVREAADIIKDKFSTYDANYATRYFSNKRINSVSDLKDVLDDMFTDLENQLLGCTLNSYGRQEYIIDYSILPGDLRHKLMNSIGLRTCPYCNRNYITRYGINGNKSTADLDHFYQKKQYPLFALSLFNFVPSCSICNSRMKNTHSADGTLYPYDEGFEDDAHFELKYTGKDFSGLGTLRLFQALESVKYDDYEVEISVDPYTSSDKRGKIEKSKELFHLTEVYANHKQDALEVALRTRIFCEGSYKSFCQKLFDKLSESGMTNVSSSDLEDNLFSDILNDEWLMFGIFTNDEKRRFDKPLSRMIYDIYNSGKK